MSNGTEPEGATPGGDTSGLIRTDLTTSDARNAAETEAIDETYAKYVHKARKKKPGSGWLTDELIRKVHSDMFGSIWEWAGKYRRHNSNLGVQWLRIPEEVKKFCGGFAVWDSDGSMPVLEIAARLQNRLTWIHPFTNGNGRHARLITDIFFDSREHRLPEWPQIHRMAQGDAIRTQYINAMKTADQGKYEDLVNFMKEYLKSD
jgi:Fic-DOC domain mobile mystery protein B